MPPLVHTDCRLFSGYKPCRHGRACEGCPHHDPVSAEILLINLDAMGDVLRTTALLPVLRRRWTGARITWLTRENALPLLQGNPLVDKALGLSLEAVLELEARRFDLLLCADKSAVAGGLAARLPAVDKRGFGIDVHGAIVPLNPEAHTLYALGLDDEAKFRRNLLPETRLLAEAFGLEWARDPYSLVLAPEEIAPGPRRAIGFNTGCSELYPLKKLPLDTQEAAIRRLAAAVGEPILLLGGPEDEARNAELARRLGPLAEPTPTREGLRRGAAEVARAEVVVSGDSLGMHLALALGAHVVAWFGLSCPAEIDLYDRGIKILAEVGCAPCWRKSCDRQPLCTERVSPEWLVEAALDCLDARRAGRPISEIRGGGWRREPG